ncbi:MAG: Bifunctional protein FolD [Candidatus Magasanikbacteria bacterium GW2011_GWA2_56_11]|uniref:Bifunctional protein FolD n=1 Tax=Candidatus Magasanikbacteria bacterium GW2011_GWA2_56_11 TaxID=1619044 RepID=A0A0G2B947_9BACT|nr:MAG: Bifunctional protein FolD [Candidatus Magasanikbacteria bacterium GW2011_GWA2_56_11]
MSNLINGRAIAEKIHAETAQKVAALKVRGLVPKLAVILVGESAPSAAYVKHKGLAAKKIGIDFALHPLPADTRRAAIIERINEIQSDPALSGLVVQLPLPEPLYTAEVLNAVLPEVDVDCLTHANLGKLVMNDQIIVPPTPGAVMSILENLGLSLAGKNVTIVGTGALVGRPLAIMMMNARASVTTVNSASRDIRQKCLHADVIVSGVGQKDLIRGDMVSPSAVVIDAGVDYVGKKMFGDVNVNEVRLKAAYVTPTPGGIGPITVARLLANTVILAERRSSLAL